MNERFNVWYVNTVYSLFFETRFESHWEMVMLGTKKYALRKELDNVLNRDADKRMRVMSNAYIEPQ